MYEKKEDGKCNIFVKESMFEMPEQPLTPIVMVGPGTGIVPFIGFLEERRDKAEKSGQKYGEAHLYFGCRRQESDFIFKDFLQNALKDGFLSSLNLAFSRADGEK